MTKDSSSQHKARMIVTSLLLFFVGLQLSLTNAVGQSRILTSWSADRATKIASNLRAAFICTPHYPNVGQAVQFLDASAGNPLTWQWDFGDGTTSTERNPTHVYTASGFRKITLTAANGTTSKKATKTLTVMPATSAATFVHSPTTPGPGQTVQFADTTSGDSTSWRWNFGDGATSTAKNPSHAFMREGSYVVTLIASNSSTSKQGSKTVTVASMSILTSSFTYTPALPTVGQSMQFTDTSAGSPAAWSWNFGDGTTSTAQNPSHAYTTAGSRTVTLTVTNSSGSNSASRTVIIATTLTASFTFSPASPAAGQSVQFTNTSAGSPTAGSWNFGDGTTSTAQNPSHAYTTAGSRTVTLTVTNSSGSNTATRTVPIVAALTAAFSYSPTSPTTGQAVQFTDTSIGTPTLWQWNFGDGATSVAQNPSHPFATAGAYTITLTVMTASGQDTTSRTITITQASPLTASFTHNPASPAAGQAVQFTDISTGNPTSWNWNFNDGSTSTTRNPSHTFPAAGSYTVALVVSNGSGSSTSTRTINVTPALTPIASFTYSPTSPAVGQAVQFTDASTGNPTSWQWNFGDGSTNTTQNPSHIFSTTGSYNVIFTIANSTGSDNFNQVISVVLASGDVHYASTPSSADIQAAINAASDGDTVQVPAGSVTWTSNVSIPATKGIKLIGAGIGSANINLGGYYLALNTRSTNSPVRVSGFRFTNTFEACLRINSDYAIGATNWRVDHCEWATSTAIGAKIGIYGYTFGVIDNCVFQNQGRSFWLDARTNTDNPPTNYYGSYSWTQPIGGASAVYMEDCTFNNTTSSILGNMRGGARLVFRYNTVTGSTGIETHSGCTPGFRNPRWVEIYENDFDLNGGSYWCGLFLRSTNGAVFNNTFSAGYPISIRFDCETICRTDCLQPWPTANSTVYPAQDQIGTGLDTGWGTSQSLTEAKLWIWDNTLGGNLTSPQFTTCTKSAELIQLGRDYFLSAPPGYTPYAYPHPLRNY